MYYTVIKHSGNLRTLEKCRKHLPAAHVFYISRAEKGFLVLLVQVKAQGSEIGCDCLSSYLLFSYLSTRALVLPVPLILLSCKIKILTYTRFNLLQPLSKDRLHDIPKHADYLMIANVANHNKRKLCHQLIKASSRNMQPVLSKVTQGRYIN